MMTLTPFSYLLFELIPTSNMTFKIIYASLGTDILRICRTNTEPNSFKSSCQALISRMICQRANLKSIGLCLGYILVIL